jgi:2-dehydropantoate 2-reductase
VGSVYVIGTGGIGLLLQFLLQEHCGSTLVARGAALEALDGHSLEVTGALTGSLQPKTLAWDDLPRVGPDDTVFLATGARGLAATLEVLRARMDPRATVILCQNGIGIHEQAETLLGCGRLLRMHCWLGASKRAVTHIDVLGIYKVDLSGSSDQKPLLERWQQVFEDASVHATLGHDVPHAEWTKALWTIALHGICAVTDAPIGAVQQSADMERLARMLMDEAVEVAALDGIHLARDDVDDVIRWIASAPDLINATSRDLAAGRPHDLDVFNGAVVASAARHGRKAPANEVVLRLVNYLQDADRCSPADPD